MEGQSCSPGFIGWDITGPVLSEAAGCLITWHGAALTSCCTLAAAFWRPCTHPRSLTPACGLVCLCVVGNNTFFKLFSPAGYFPCMITYLWHFIKKQDRILSEIYGETNSKIPDNTGQAKPLLLSSGRFCLISEVLIIIMCADWVSAEKKKTKNIHNSIKASVAKYDIFWQKSHISIRYEDLTGSLAYCSCISFFNLAVLVMEKIVPNYKRDKYKPQLLVHWQLVYPILSTYYNPYILKGGGTRLHLCEGHWTVN